MEPSVTVVVPLFNKRDYITRCLDSVLRQTFRNFEVIVVDDGSTDGSGDVARSLGDNRIRVYPQRNQGASAARRVGALLASGELVAFLDADDEWEPDFLSAVLALAERFPQAALLCTGYRRMMPSGVDRIVTLASGDQQTLITDFFLRVRDGEFVTSSSNAVRRTVLAELGDFSVSESFGEDAVLWARIALRSPLAYDTRILAVYHSEDNQGITQQVLSEPPAVPPVIRVLHQALAAGEVPEPERDRVRAYSEWRAMKHADWLIDLQQRSWLIDFLKSQSFSSKGYVWKKYSVLTGARMLPMKLLRVAFFKSRSVIDMVTCYWRTPLVRVTSMNRAVVLESR